MRGTLEHGYGASSELWTPDEFGPLLSTVPLLSANHSDIGRTSAIMNLTIALLITVLAVSAEATTPIPCGSQVCNISECHFDDCCGTRVASCGEASRPTATPCSCAPPTGTSTPTRAASVTPTPSITTTPSVTASPSIPSNNSDDGCTMVNDGGSSGIVLVGIALALWFSRRRVRGF